MFGTEGALRSLLSPGVTATHARHPLQPHIQLDARVPQRAAGDTRGGRIGDCVETTEPRCAR
jgi:hypothetical protein